MPCCICSRPVANDSGRCSRCCPPSWARNPDSDDVTIAGAVIELVHLATLYHDDVMDEAQVRRGAPSANLRWSNNVAILAGDYLFADGVPAGVAAGPGRGADHRRDLRPAGHRSDARNPRGAADKADPIAHYLKVVHEKTACLIGAAGRFGAMFSGADADQTERLSRLGDLVGTAFQISDDIIDIDSDPDESGKLPGTDLREGVHTLPVLYALHDSGPDADRLRELLAGPIEDDASARRGADVAAGLSRHGQGQGDRCAVRGAGPRGTGRTARRPRTQRARDARGLHNPPTG